MSRMLSLANSLSAVTGAGPLLAFLRSAAASVDLLFSTLGPLVYNAQVLGAVGDGAFDNTTVLNQALQTVDAAGGGTLLLPPGVYRITGQLNFTGLSNVTLSGVGGAVILAEVADIAIGGGGATNCAVQDLTVQGVGARMLAFSTATGLKLSRCRVSGSVLDATDHEPAGIWLSGTTDSSVTECVLSGNGRQRVFTADVGTSTFSSAAHGFSDNNQVHVFSVGGSPPSPLAAGIDYHVVNATIDDFQISATEGGAPIAITDAGSGTLKISLLTVDIFAEFSGHTRLHLMQNNCVSSQTVVGILTENAVDSVVGNNIVYGVSGSGANDGYGICVSQTTLSERVLVVSNVVRSCAGSGIYFRGASKCTAVGNAVSNCCLIQDDTTLNVAGIAATNGPHEFTGNLITDSQKSGISWSGSCSCVGNTIETAVKEGIWVRGAASNSLVNANRIKDAGVRGILSESAVANVTVTNNQIQAPGNNGIEFTLGVSGGIVTANFISSAGGKGIVLVGGSVVAVEGNVVNGTGDTGIHCTASHAQITGNNVTAATGKGLLASGDYSTVVDNDLVGNSVVGYTLGGASPIATGNRFSTGTCSGTAVLGPGTATVNTAEVQIGDTVRVSRAVLATVPANSGAVAPGNIVAGTSFDLTSSVGADDGSLYWEIVH